jgi:hypothetical protein
MSRYAQLQEETFEREQNAWEAVARKNGFVCSLCGALLSKDELNLFGDRCSAHQGGWDKEDSK